MQCVKKNWLIIAEHVPGQVGDTLYTLRGRGAK